jgi:ABC-type antimicrobial peptide transport system permease subunit
MRAIGLTKYRVVLIYVYESFVLVFSSSLLGVAVGTLVGFTMALQRIMFLAIPLQFYFPSTELLAIALVSLVCALLSTLSPAIGLVRKEIASIFRFN